MNIARISESPKKSLVANGIKANNISNMKLCVMQSWGANTNIWRWQPLGFHVSQSFLKERLQMGQSCTCIIC